MTTLSPFEINPRVAAMQPSQTMAMTAKSKELQRAGRPVIGLSAGEPDFNTPAVISEAGIQAIKDGHTHYTANPGIPELREAICEKLKRDNGLDYTPAQILCSNGAKQSVAQAIMALLRPGDEVLIPAPYWVSYPEMTRLAGGVPIALPTDASSEYRITPAQLEAAITEKSRILMLCSPSNPTGSVYTREELSALAEVVAKHDNLFVISDEIYEYITFDAEQVSFASLPGMLEKTVTVNGFSKAYAMTGWRLGYMAGPEFVVKAAGKIQGQVTSAPSAITQHAGVAALKMDMQPIYDMVDAFRGRRDFVLEQLNKIEGISCPKPEGAFYLFPDVGTFLNTTAPSGREVKTSTDLCFFLLEEHDVALVPGDAFGAPAGLRISYAAAMDDLKVAMERITTGLKSLKK